MCQFRVKLRENRWIFTPNERELSRQVPDVYAKCHQNPLKIATVRARRARTHTKTCRTPDTANDHSSSHRPLKFKRSMAWAVATSCCISAVFSQWEGEIFDPPQLQNLWSDRPETQILETSTRGHPGYGYGRIKGVGGASSQFVTSLVLPFLHSLPSVPVAALERSRRLMGHMTRFRPRKCLLGVSMTKINV